MNNLIILLVFSMSFSVWAGPGHPHSKDGGHEHAKKSKSSHSHGGQSHSHGSKSLSEDEIRKTGKTHVDRLVKESKIDNSWKGSTFNKSEKKKFGKKTEWVLTYDNAKGVKGKRLFIFLTLGGEFVAANFTGK